MTTLIISAGAAGIAGRDAALDAHDRTGGRVYTNPSLVDVPADQGAGFVPEDEAPP